MFEEILIEWNVVYVLSLSNMGCQNIRVTLVVKWLIALSEKKKFYDFDYHHPLTSSLTVSYFNQANSIAQQMILKSRTNVAVSDSRYSN